MIIFPGELPKPERLEDEVPGTVFQGEDGETPEEFDQRCHECNDGKQISELQRLYINIPDQLELI